MFDVSICRGESIATPGGPNFDIAECPGIVVFLPPFSDSINFDFKEVLNQKVLMIITYMCVTFLLLEALWINSNPYHIFSFSFTFLHLLPALPICVATWIKPPLSVNMAGTLFPTAQQLPSLLVKRISSANFPFLRLTPSNELMYKANFTLNAGPQVGIVPTRLLWTAGAPSATKIHALNMGRKIYPKKCVTYSIHH